MTLADQSILDADLVVAAIGVRPDSQLARDAGLECAPNGGIVVDRNLTTRDPHIYVAGDAVAKHDAVDGCLVLVPLAQTANLQGHRIADRIMGREIGDRPVLGTAIVDLFGLQAATVGWNEKRLRAAGAPTARSTPIRPRPCRLLPRRHTDGAEAARRPLHRRDHRTPGRGPQEC